MPNERNVTMPITLIAQGRSGTSLIHKCFEYRPDCDVVGECADLIFGSWYSCEQTRDIVRPDHKLRSGGQRSIEEQWSEGVRSLFLAMFDSPKQYWFQKPIGLSFCSTLKDRLDGGWSGYCRWYWNVLRNIFPQGKYMTILRDPRDVVLSSKEYWGADPRNIVENIVLMSECIAHKDSEIHFAISYNDMVENPEFELKRICQYAEIPYLDSMLTPTQMLHVPKVQVEVEKSSELIEEKRRRKFSRKEEWISVESLFTGDDWHKINSCWERFGQTLPVFDGQH